MALGFGIPPAAGWTVTGTTGLNAAGTVSKAGTTGNYHYVHSIEAIIKGAAAGSDFLVTLKDGTTVMWQEAFGSAAPKGERVGIVFGVPIRFTVSNAVNLETEAGGTGAAIVLNVAGFTLTARLKAL